MMTTSAAVYVGILFVGCLLTRIELDGWAIIKTAFCSILLASLLFMSLSLYADSIGMPEWLILILTVIARMFGTFFGAAVFLTDPLHAAVLAVMTFLVEVMFVSGLILAFMVAFPPAV